MPQLDVATYFSQIFWLGFFFILLLVVSIKFMLPRVAAIHEKRWQKIEGTRAQALALQHQAEDVQRAFEQHLADARKQAQEKILQASKEILLSQEKTKLEINVRLKDQFQVSERKIFAQKDSFMDQVQSMAHSLTTDIVQKILTEKLSSPSVEQPIDYITSEKASTNNVS